MSNYSSFHILPSCLWPAAPLPRSGHQPRLHINQPQRGLSSNRVLFLMVLLADWAWLDILIPPPPPMYIEGDSCPSAVGSSVRVGTSPLCAPEEGAQSRACGCEGDPGGKDQRF